MSSSDNMPVLFKRRIIDNSVVESKVLISKDIVNIRSAFEGNKGYLARTDIHDVPIEIMAALVLKHMCITSPP
jgi:hypothetical protein